MTLPNPKQTELNMNFHLHVFFMNVSFIGKNEILITNKNLIPDRVFLQNINTAELHWEMGKKGFFAKPACKWEVG